MESTRIYKVSPRRRTALYGGWAVIALFLLIHGLLTREVALLIAGAIVTATMLPVFFLAVRAARLIVTADGIEVRQLGATLKTPWSNILELRLARGSEGFVLREPIAGRGAERVADTAQVIVFGASMYDPDRRALLGQQRFIPIEAFGYWLQHGDLRQVIAQHAPALVSTSAAAEPALSPQRQVSRARVVLIAIIITAAAGIGLAMAMQPPEDQAFAFRLFEVPLTLVLILFSANNAVAAGRQLRARRYSSGVLWGSLAIIQILMALAIFGHLLAP